MDKVDGIFIKSLLGEPCDSIISSHMVIVNNDTCPPNVVTTSHGLAIAHATESGPVNLFANSQSLTSGHKTENRPGSLSTESHTTDSPPINKSTASSPIAQHTAITLSLPRQRAGNSPPSQTLGVKYNVLSSRNDAINSTAQPKHPTRFQESNEQVLKDDVIITVSISIPSVTIISVILIIIRCYVKRRHHNHQAVTQDIEMNVMNSSHESSVAITSSPSHESSPDAESDMTSPARLLPSMSSPAILQLSDYSPVSNRTRSKDRRRSLFQGK